MPRYLAGTRANLAAAWLTPGILVLGCRDGRGSVTVRTGVARIGEIRRPVAIRDRKAPIRLTTATRASNRHHKSGRWATNANAGAHSVNHDFAALTVSLMRRASR